MEQAVLFITIYIIYILYYSMYICILVIEGLSVYIYISKSDWTKPGYRHSCQNKRDAKAMSIVNQVRQSV